MFGEIRNAAGERLDYRVHPSDGNGVVVIGHGVTGNKDRPFLVALGSGPEGAGITTLRFSFSGNGDSEGRFRDSTITEEVADLGCLLDAVGDRPVVFVGHSMGGAVGVVRARADRRHGRHRRRLAGTAAGSLRRARRPPARAEAPRRPGIQAAARTSRPMADASQKRWRTGPQAGSS